MSTSWSGLVLLMAWPRVLSSCQEKPTLVSLLILTTNNAHRLICRVAPQLAASPLDLEIKKLNFSFSFS